MLEWNNGELEEIVIETEDQSQQVVRMESMLKELEAITKGKKNLKMAYTNDAITLDELKQDLAEDEEFCCCPAQMHFIAL